MSKIFANFFLILIQDNVLYILVEFGSDRMSHCESTKNGQMGAHGLNWKIFAKSEVKFENYKKITPGNKFLCLYVAFQILAIFEIFEISNGHFGQMAQIFENFFLWFLLSIIFAKFW